MATLLELRATVNVLKAKRVVSSKEIEKELKRMLKTSTKLDSKSEKELQHEDQ
jgi:hypothetical protein